jgi:O-antigen ligase
MAVAVDQQAGIGALWRPLSLVPYATRNSLWALAVPISVFLLGIQLDDRQRSRLLPIICVLGVLSAMWGLLQILGEPGGSLYFYQAAGNDGAVGFFANRNHQAFFLASAIPMLSVWWRARDDRHGHQAIIGGILVFAAIAFLLILILVTGSRAGSLIALIAVILAGIAPIRSWSFRGRQGQGRRRQTSHGSPARRRIGGVSPLLVFGLLLVAGAILIILIASWSGRAFALQRLLETDPGRELRLRSLPVIVSMIGTYLPWGAGLGTFEQVYLLHEPRSLIGPMYMNHAHNDWLEMILTAGIPGMVVIVAGSGLFLKGVWSMVRARHRPALSVLGLQVLFILGLASLSDYPLRTPSLACLAAIATLWAWPSGKDGSAVSSPSEKN